MADATARPELIFLTGPQAGERAVLMTNPAVLGRAASTDIRLKEQAVSREQLAFTYTNEGWLMENRSANGTLVNGKRYKRRDQKLALDTGDVVGVGIQTLILYVAGGDDPEAALAAWRDANPDIDTTPTPAPAGGAPAGEGEGPRTDAAGAPEKKPGKKEKGDREQKPKGKKAAAGGEAGEHDDAESEEEDEEDDETGSVKLKIILAFLVLLGIVIFGIAMILRSGGPGPQDAGPTGPSRLTNEEIRQAIEAPVDRPPSRTKAAEHLQRAVHSYENRVLWEPGDLYRCVKDFKLHKAYRNAQSLSSIRHEQMFHDAMEELVGKVQQRYDAAWRLEKARSWRNAKLSFEEILIILPIAELDRNGEIYQTIFLDVRDHLNLIKSKMGRVE